MNKNFVFKNCLIAAAVLSITVGCGGSAVVAGQSVAGNWVLSPQDQHNVTWTISGNGNVSGRSENFTLGGTDTLTGTVQSSGAFTGTIRNDQNVGVQYTVNGTVMSETDSNHIRVIYDGTVNNAPRHVDMLMVRAGFANPI